MTTIFFDNTEGCSTFGCNFDDADVMNSARFLILPCTELGDMTKLINVSNGVNRGSGSATVSGSLIFFFEALSTRVIFLLGEILAGSAVGFGATDAIFVLVTLFVASAANY